MSYFTTIREAEKRTYLRLPGHVLPEPQEGIFQLYLLGNDDKGHKFGVRGNHRGEEVSMYLDGKYADESIRVHKHGSRVVEDFVYEGVTSSAIITDDGWFKYKDYEEIEDGYLLKLESPYGDEYLLETFYGEALDADFIGFYNLFMHRAQAELELRELLGFDRDYPFVREILIQAEDVPAASLPLSQYKRADKSLTTVPDVRESEPWEFGRS